MNMHCSMTGIRVSGPADAIWDDGEWISWDYINRQIEESENREAFAGWDETKAGLLEDLVSTARNYYESTGRHLQIFGELGELYAELKYGLVRHRPHAQGSDGRIGNDFVEVKTISPDKNCHKVSVKRAGNFSKLIVVKINSDYGIESKILPRSKLVKGEGKKASVSWDSIQNEN